MGLTLSAIVGSLGVQPDGAIASSDPLQGTDPPLLRVSDLRDVNPEDWAFQAVQSLVERDRCLKGNSTQQFLGDKPLTRWEFAAALSLCFLTLEQNLDSESIATIQQLQTDFAPDLNQIRSQIEQTEKRLAPLESQQFSSTTKLSGEAIMALIGVLGDRADGSGDPIDANVTLSPRLRLDFESSFSGRDRLRIRLQSRNIPELEAVTDTQMANLSFDGADGNGVELADLDYEFPIGKRTQVFVSAEGGGLRDFIPSVDPYFSSSGKGSISTFGRENSITRQGGGAGIGFNHDLTQWANVGIGYVANNAENPEEGLFGDRYGAVAQLTLTPVKKAKIGLTYVRSFNNFDTGTGSAIGSDPFDDEAESVDANSWSVEASVDVTPRINLGARAGLIQATANDLDDSPTADIVTWAAHLALPDLGREDSLLGLVIGQPPKVTRNQFIRDRVDPDSTLHVEAFYRFQMNDHIGITPGIVVLVNPEHDSGNAPIYVGTVRTTFRF